jgi:hypothetical protein
MSIGVTDPAPAAPPAEAPLDRARRILSGDVRPDDYLPVTPEVLRLANRVVEAGRERVRSAGIPDVDPAWAREVLFDHILLVHCKNQHVAYLRDDHGIIVLMTGLDEYARMFRELPSELWSGRVGTDYPTDAVFFL